MPPSALPIATALPAWCAPHDAAKRRKDIRLLVGTRLVTLEGFEVIAYPTDRAAYGRLCRLLSRWQSQGEERRMPFKLSKMYLRASDGQMLIALPPRITR